jgi:ABC-2 type transport system ATP-binding protein
VRTVTRSAPAGLAPAVSARGLVYRYGDRVALDGLDLEIPRGLVFGVLGPNGSGKSTLISLLTGLRKPEAGAVEVLGVAPSPAARRRIGFVFQENALDPLMSVEETLRLQGRLMGLDAAAIRERSRNLLAQVALLDRLSDDVGGLSGGMKRRLEIARAVLHDPELLVMDEATVGLDPESRQQAWAALDELRADGCTILLATNEVYEAERHCDEVAFLSAGRCVAQGTPDELKRGLKHDSVTLHWPGFPPELLATLQLWPGVGQVTHSDGVVHATVDDARTFVPRLFAEGYTDIRELQIHESTLEDAFFDVTGASMAVSQAAPPAEPQVRRRSR